MSKLVPSGKAQSALFSGCRVTYTDKHGIERQGVLGKLPNKQRKNAIVEVKLYGKVKHVPVAVEDLEVAK